MQNTKILGGRLLMFNKRDAHHVECPVCSNKVIVTTDTQTSLVTSLVKVEDARPPWLRKAEEAINFGRTFFGVDYKFNSNHLVDGLFDCSDFTRHIFRHVGIQLPRNSRQQSTVGQAVSYQNLREGDLMFFSTPAREHHPMDSIERIGHVAVYTGTNRILHTFRVGIGVIEMDIDSHWRGRFIKAQRVI
jgi:cell wall-associated NlpC family hydrolase